jgi:hypothetical protein
MEIKLYMDNKEKTFTVPFIKARMFRRVIEINNKHDLNDIDVDTLDILVDFIVEVFQMQFTRDDFYDGVPSDQMMNLVLEYFNKVAGVAGGKGKSPNLQKD